MTAIAYSVQHSNDGKCYRLAKSYMHQTRIKGLHAIAQARCSLWPSGALVIHAGYTWDGPSGPALDTASFMRASLVHDALYELMRLGQVPQSARKAADQEMRRIQAEDGMSWPRRWWTYWGVRLFAGGAARRTT